MSKKVKAPKPAKTRRLSLWRVMLALLILVGGSAGSFFGVKQWRSTQAQVSHKPWFAAYTDVNATPAYAFEQLGGSATKDVVLSFIISSQTDGCSPAWGGAYSLTQARVSLDLDRRIARLKQQGGNVAISFGGLDGTELATGCADPTKLYTAYKTVIDQYHIDTIDLDVESKNLTDQAAGARRATAIAQLQSDRRKQGKPLAVWVTLPVAPFGMTEDGTNAVSQLLAKGVDLAGVNVMTMDYGQSMNGMTMLEASEKALTQTQRQIGILYQRAGLHLNNATLWAKMGATPMIGQNDNSDEVFTLDDAKGLNSFARAHGMGRMSMWSANRDVTCGSNYVDVKVVSSSCSGVKQEKQAFSVSLSNGFTGSFASSAGLVTKDDKAIAKQVADDPTNSPYQIWQESGAYLAGTKVVWHHNVYQAKWWTQGDLPDSPVLQSWQTPWDLIGPVLPGEKPIPQATLPAGTYPDWSGTTGYNTGDRVIFNGTPYQAKWWNQGNSPAAAATNADASPWVPLTQAQINAVLQTIKQ